MGHPTKTFNSLERIGLSNSAYMISIANLVAVNVDIFRIKTKLYLEK